MRPSVANAILGPCHARNSTIAIACTPRLDDPVVYLMIRLFQTMKRFLLAMSPSDRQHFYHLAHEHSGKGTDCHGPAGCLAYYLGMISWDLSPDGNVLLPDGISLSLIHTSSKQFRFWLDITRQTELLSECSQRHLLHGLVINTLETKGAIASFEVKEQQQLINEISGAFQTAHQKSQWAADQDDQCAFCDQPGSRFHRVHACNAFAHIRREYQVDLDYYLQREILIHELPVIYLHDDCHTLQSIARQHVEAQLPQQMSITLQTLINQGRRLQFYTDGPLLFPQVRTARHGAYSIVLDTCVSDVERIRAAQLYLTTGDMPNSLKTLSVARICGHQTLELNSLQWYVYVSGSPVSVSLLMPKPFWMSLTSADKPVQSWSWPAVQISTLLNDCGQRSRLGTLNSPRSMPIRSRVRFQMRCRDTKTWATNRPMTLLSWPASA